MPGRHIFLSYASADRPRAELFVRALEDAGWSVFWDRAAIPPGERFSRVIGEAIQDAQAMVVLWSARSTGSDWVLDEAQEGKERGILVPVLIDDVEVPRGFRQLHHARLLDWRGDPRDRELRRLLDAIERLSPSPTRRIAPPPLRAPHEEEAAPGVVPDAPEVAPPAVNRPINLGFDGPDVEGLPSGWFNSFGYVAGVSLAYRCLVVARPEANGACLLLEKSGAHEDEFGAIMQRCAATALAGRTVRFSAELRSQGVRRWAGLWLRVDGDEQADLYFDNMHRRPIRGTTDWAFHHIDAQLPKPTRWLNYGVVLAGDGQVWADNCSLLVWTEEGRWREW